jgi:hypothetical protein
VANAAIDNLVVEMGWEVVFGTSVVEIEKVCADANSSMLFANKDGCCVGFVTWVRKTTTLACLDEPSRQDISF